MILVMIKWNYNSWRISSRQREWQHTSSVKNCASFTDCIIKINNILIDNAKDNDVVMTMYNLIEYSDNYWKILGNLRQYYRDEPSVNNNYVINNFSSNTVSFKFKQKITGVADADGTKNVEIIVPL